MFSVNNELSTWLARELNERSWSSRELARRINLSHTSVSRYLEGSLIPAPKTCQKIAKALGIPDPRDVMRLAGHLPPASEPVAQEEELLTIVRTLPGDTRDVILQMLRGLAAPSYTLSARPVTALAELPPVYQFTLDDQIAALVEQYPDLGPLLVQAQRDLPEHAAQALIHNVEIWIEKEQTENFVNLHRALTDFFMVQSFLKKKEERGESCP